MTSGSDTITDTATEPPATPSELLEAELAAARLRPSRRLAPERALAARTGLSRTAVRRWLDELERAGRVTRHVGRGTFVMPSESPVHLDTSPAEIMAVRLLLEPQLLGLAVANATGGDIAEMRRWLALGEAAESYDEFERCDSRLHGAIAASTHNSLLIRLLNVINDSRDHPLWGTAKRRTFTPQLRHDYEADHRQLVDAIDDRDAEQAALVMTRHLQRIRTALLGR